MEEGRWRTKEGRGRKEDSLEEGSERREEGGGRREESGGGGGGGLWE